VSALLERGLDALGIAPSPRVTGLLEAYCEQIALWNRRTNLVRATGDDLVVRHLLDALAAARDIESLAAGGPVADVGSGAGLPGIPLAIQLDALRFVLVERATVRAAFLRSCAAVLGLANVEVVDADVQDLPGRSFPLVTFRAFRPLSRALAEVAAIVAPGGAVAAYAGRKQALDEELAQLPAGYRLRNIRRLEVPFLDAERHIVIFEREAAAGG
jgi:16S rRNA (guanine527-N7)-methyltransferase